MPRAATSASCSRALLGAIGKIVDRVGIDHAKKLWQLSEVGLDDVRKTIYETDMPGVDLVEGGWLEVSKTDEAEDDLQRHSSA